jgi:quinol monooxygenase YgiN
MWQTLQTDAGRAELGVTSQTRYNRVLPAGAAAAMLGGMNAKPVTVVARMKAKPGKEAEVRKELLSLVAPSRKDEGCLNYDLHQGADSAAQFVFYENWVTRELLDQHLKQPHLQQALARLGSLLAEPPDITLWEKIS